MNHIATERAVSSEAAQRVPESGESKNSHRWAVILAGAGGIT
jgi:hypothetical protein